MATTFTLADTILAAAGPAADLYVVATLCNLDGEEVEAHIAGEPGHIVIPQIVQTDSTGAFSMELVANGDLSTTNTYYKIEAGKGSTPVIILVDQDGDLSSLRVVDPEDLEAGTVIRGEDGQDGDPGPAGVNPSGPWQAPGGGYHETDIVEHEGSAWIYNDPSPSTGKVPGVDSEWLLFVSKGDPGAGLPAGSSGDEGKVPVWVGPGEEDYELDVIEAGVISVDGQTGDVDLSAVYDPLGAAAAALAASQPLDADLTAIAALSTTSFGRALLALADAAAGRTALGLGTAATQPTSAFDAAGAAASAQAASQPLDSDLTAIAALTTTSFGRAFLALADAAAGRTALGLGTAATQATGAFDSAGAAAAAQAASQPLDSDLTAIAALSTTSFGRSVLALADAAALRTLAGLVPGTDVQAFDTELAALAGLTSAANKVPYFTGSGAASLADFTAAGRALIDDADASAQRTTLGLGALATLSAISTTEITDGTIANADLANMARGTFKGRDSSGTGVPEDVAYSSWNGRGVVGSRPAAAIGGRTYQSTDEGDGIFYRDNGSSWDEVARLAPRRGRWKFAGTSYPFVPGLTSASTISTKALAANRLYYQFMFVDAPVPFTHLWAECTTAGASAHIRFGIYKADTDRMPTTLLGEATGTNAALNTGTVASGQFASGAVTTLLPGRYLIAYCVDVASTFRSWRGSVDHAVDVLGGSTGSLSGVALNSFTYGALPSTGSIPDTPTTAATPFENVVMLYNA